MIPHLRSLVIVLLGALAGSIQAEERPYYLPDLSQTVEQIERGDMALDDLSNNPGRSDVTRDPDSVNRYLDTLDVQISRVEHLAHRIHYASCSLSEQLRRLLRVRARNQRFVTAWRPNIEGNRNMLRMAASYELDRDSLRQEVAMMILASLVAGLERRVDLVAKAKYIEQRLSQKEMKLEKVKAVLRSEIYGIREDLRTVRPH